MWRRVFSVGQRTTQKGELATPVDRPAFYYKQVYNSPGPVEDQTLRQHICGSVLVAEAKKGGARSRALRPGVGEKGRE